MEKSASTILAEYGVSEKQYSIWAWQQFRNQTTWWGMMVTALFVGPFLGLAVRAFSQGNMEDFWIALFGMVIVGMIFVIGIFWARSTSIDYAYRNKAYTPKGFEAIDVERRMSLKYVKKLKPKHWEAVRKIDVQAFEKREAAKRPGPRLGTTKERLERLLKLKKRARNWGFIGLGLLILDMVAMAYFFETFMSGGLGRMLGVGIFDLFYITTVLGMHGWLFLYGYLGFLERKIKLHAEYTWDDTVHHGKSATVFGVIAMMTAVLSFLLFMVVPVALFMI